jgi:tetratricopeptide (TPR) repeat protein
MSIPRISAVTTSRCTLLFLAVVSLMAAGCSRESKTVGAIKKHLEDKDYREVIFLCKHAIDDKLETAEIRCYYGLSLLAVGRDFEAYPQLERAAALDSGLVPIVSERLFEAGKFDFNERRLARASSRMMEAAKLDTALSLGRFSYLIADEYYRDKDYGHAVRFYEEALNVQADTSIAAQSMMRLAEGYTRLDSLDLAEEVYEEIIDRFPRGEFANDARWNLASLFLDKGRKQLALGEFEEALDLAEALLDVTDNVTMVQNARFLMGEAYEGLSDFDSALEQYKAIVRSDRGASGSVVQRARGKIESYRRAGLYK